VVDGYRLGDWVSNREGGDGQEGDLPVDDCLAGGCREDDYWVAGYCQGVCYYLEACYWQEAVDWPGDGFVEGVLSVGAGFVAEGGSAVADGPVVFEPVGKGGLADVVRKAAIAQVG
jgi:hypothetical protein